MVEQSCSRASIPVIVLQSAEIFEGVGEADEDDLRVGGLPNMGKMQSTLNDLTKELNDLLHKVRTRRTPVHCTSTLWWVVFVRSDVLGWSVTLSPQGVVSGGVQYGCFASTDGGFAG